MAGLREQYSTNPKAEAEGKWLDATTLDDGRVVRFLLARLGGANKRGKIVSEKVTKPFRRQISRNSLSEEQAIMIAKKIFIRACLLDWENVDDVNGEPMEYTEENAMELFTDLPELYKDLATVVQDYEFFLEEEISDDSKN